MLVAVVTLWLYLRVSHLLQCHAASCTRSTPPPRQSRGASGGVLLERTAPNLACLGPFSCIAPCAEMALQGHIPYPRSHVLCASHASCPVSHLMWVSHVPCPKSCVLCVPCVPVPPLAPRTPSTHRLSNLQQPLTFTDDSIFLLEKVPFRGRERLSWSA